MKSGTSGCHVCSWQALARFRGVTVDIENDMLARYKYAWLVTSYRLAKSERDFGERVGQDLSCQVRLLLYWFIAHRVSHWLQSDRPHWSPKASAIEHTHARAAPDPLVSCWRRQFTCHLQSVASSFRGTARLQARGQCRILMRNLLR